jgi:hypothetical protein
MDADQSLRRLREELDQLGLGDLPAEVMQEIEQAGLAGGRVRLPLSALDRSDLHASSRRVSVTRRTVNGATRTEIRETGPDGVERVYRSLDEAPPELRAWIERTGAGLPPAPPGWADAAGQADARTTAAGSIPVVDPFPVARSPGGSGVRTILLGVIAAALLAILGVLVWIAVK